MGLRYVVRMSSMRGKFLGCVGQGPEKGENLENNETKVHENDILGAKYFVKFWMRIIEMKNLRSQKKFGEIEIENFFKFHKILSISFFVYFSLPVRGISISLSH